MDKFNNLLDIAHADALNIISIDENKNVLLNQRKKERQGSMLSTNYSLALIDEEKRIKKYLNEIREK